MFYVPPEPRFDTVTDISTCPDGKLPDVFPITPLMSAVIVLCNCTAVPVCHIRKYVGTLLYMFIIYLYTFWLYVILLLSVKYNVTLGLVLETVLEAVSC